MLELRPKPSLQRSRLMNAVSVFLLRRAFAAGMPVLTEYLQQTDAHMQAIDPTATKEGEGGLLGVESVQEVVVGVPDAGRAGHAWDRFLSPITPDETGVYRLGRGPALRLVPDAKPKIQTMVLKVASLDQALAAARDAGLRATSGEGHVTVMLPHIQGVTLQLLRGES